MPVPRPTEKQILDRIYNRIRNETSITASLDSSVIGVILKIIAAEMDSVWSYVEELYRQSNLSTASGPALDNFGLLFGVIRRAALKSTTSGQTRSVRFTNLGSTSANVQSGTRVYKNSDPQIAYFTTESITLAAGDSGDVHVTAANVGEIYNVGIGELNAHSAPNVTVSVTNILPIQNGSFLESDASYRERILQEITRKDGLNVYNTEALLRGVPGVKDVFIVEFKRGAGTFDAVIIPYNIESTAAIVGECQRLLNEAGLAGVSARATAPQYRQLDIRLNIRFAPGVGERRDIIRESVRSQIISRIDNLPVETGNGNGTFYTSQIKSSALLADPANVLDVNAVLGLDGSPLSSDGEIRLAIGERLVLRSLSVE